MIDKKTRKLAVMASALAAVCVLAAACDGGDDDDDSFTPELILKGDGSPANFACNGTFTDPVSTGTNIAMNFLVLSQETTGTPPSPNSRIVVFDTATGTTNGAFAATTNSAGRAAIGGLEDSTRYSVKVSRTGGTLTYVDTYTFNTLSPAVGSTSGSTTLRVITTTVYSVFLGLLSVPAEDIAGTTQIAGSIEDCDGDAVQNAYVEVNGPGGTGVAKRCDEADHGYPCIAYFRNSTPNKEAFDSDTDGQFVVIGAPVGTPFEVRVMGVTATGGTPEQIGEATIRGVADTVSLVQTTPLGP